MIFALVACTILLILPFLAQAQTPRGGISREDLARALLNAHLLSTERHIVRLAEVCTLRIGRQSFPVIDLFEEVRGAEVPRGYKRVVVLTPNLQKLVVIPYDPPAEPLFCHNNILFFSGMVTLNNTLPQGNALLFGLGAQQIDLQTYDNNALPAPTAANLLQQLQ